uniref:Uncharacterized protein n=1 Tax=uncultured marine virus TaxID=186617 RepID=A0A0F7L3K2_9VIRU|nr:hypothetical protein [uncultured marine virus]
MNSASFALNAASLAANLTSKSAICFSKSISSFFSDILSSLKSAFVNSNVLTVSPSLLPVYNASTSFKFVTAGVSPPSKLTAFKTSGKLGAPPCSSLVAP